MATKEQIELIEELIHETHPDKFLKNVDGSLAGIGAVIRFLHQEQKPVSAGMIAEFTGVSTARVAVLLKKMTAKGLIIKEKNPFDARSTIVRLSEYGYQFACAREKEMYQSVGRMIDQVGMERMLEFIAIAREIKDILPDPVCMEDCLK